MKKPKIRFKGYTEDWEQRKLGELTDIKSASRVHKGEWRANGVPFYRSSDVMAAFNGTENEKAFISEELYERLSEASGKLEQGDILVTGGGSVGTPYIVPDNSPLYTKDADLIWIKNSEKLSPEFVYTYFISPTFKTYLTGISHVGTIAHYTIEQVKGTPISLPSKEEQERVGKYFAKLDNLITLHQRKCEEAKKMKKFMLQKMFPQNGASVPEIRFSGFTEDWEQRKLVDVLERRIEQRQQSEEYPRLAFASGQGVIPLSERKTNNREQLTKDEFTKKYLVTELDDIVYNPANVKYGAIDRNKCGRGLISPIYVTFITTEEPGFIERIVTSHDFQQRALRFEEGTVTKRQSVNPEDLVTLDILVAPQREEQKKISAYFDGIDHLITLHQRKCDELQNMKKFMLQNMFV